MTVDWFYREWKLGEVKFLVREAAVLAYELSGPPFTESHAGLHTQMGG